MRERIKGPEKHGRRWRVVHYARDGKSVTHSFETKAEAERAGKALRKGLKDERLTVEAALEEYEQYMRRKGNREGSIRTTLFRLHGLLEVDRAVVSYSRQRAATSYAVLASRDDVSVDTHRNTLGQAKTFWRWLIKRGYVRTNPWESVEPVGRRRRGKEQLTHGEARRLLAYCESHSGPGEVACLLALVGGMRASEIGALEERHCDVRTGLVRVPGTKTDAARRLVRIQQETLVLVVEQLPLQFNRHRLLSAAKATMRAAGVTEVTLHGLRGTHATLAVGAGESPLAVAAALGHASDTVTRNHYIAPGTVDLATQQRALQALVPDFSTDVAPSEEGKESELESSTKTSAKGGTRTPTALTTRSLVLCESRYLN